MTRIAYLDFETYYDADYSLSKITTEEYIRDPRFEVIGLGVRFSDETRARWYSKPDVEAFLHSEDWSKTMIVAQNTLFDAPILAWHYNVTPMAWGDTMGMSRALFPHERSHSLDAQLQRMGHGVKGNTVHQMRGKRFADFTVGELAEYRSYCINDVECTKDLFEYYMRLGFPKVELRLIDMTIRMFTEPVLQVDVPLLEKHLGDVQQRKIDLLDDVKNQLIESGDPDAIHALFTDGIPALKKLLMSNPRFAQALERLGVEPPMKASPATGKPTYAFAKTDEGFIALQEHPDTLVQALCAARLGVKSTLEETRTERFIGIGKRGLMPVPLRYAAAHSLRWGGCLVADTRVLVYDVADGVREKKIVDVLLSDLVWDGVEFVSHEGVSFSGYQEVITWDGVTGTPEHVVFTDAGSISLREAMQAAQRIQTASDPTANAVDAARKLASNDKR